jgi:hypothetical protein
MTDMLIISVVDRLATSRDRYLKALEEEGARLGYAWASNAAEYIELERLARFDPSESEVVVGGNGYAISVFIDDVNDGHMRLEISRDLLSRGDSREDDDGLDMDEFWRGFLTGALELYWEVAPRLHA